MGICFFLLRCLVSSEESERRSAVLHRLKRPLISSYSSFQRTVRRDLLSLHSVKRHRWRFFLFLLYHLLFLFQQVQAKRFVSCGRGASYGDERDLLKAFSSSLPTFPRHLKGEGHTRKSYPERKLSSTSFLHSHQRSIARAPLFFLSSAPFSHPPNLLTTPASFSSPLSCKSFSRHWNVLSLKDTGGRIRDRTRSGCCFSPFPYHEKEEDMYDHRTTSLCMARSRSRPIYRAPHPGLKQLVLREKFWMRFEPNRNRLLHTPEYQELLFYSQQHKKRRAASSSTDTRTLCKDKEEEDDDEDIERMARDLDQEERDQLHKREVAYKRQQPKFRPKKVWGTGRWRKEEGYLLTLLDSHRQKVLDHVKKRMERKIAFQRHNERQRRMHASSMSAHDSSSQKEGRSQESERIHDNLHHRSCPKTAFSSSMHEKERKTEKHQEYQLRLNMIYNSLSYSFVIMEVVPHLAWLEQKHQRDSLNAWKRRWHQAKDEEEEQETVGRENKKKQKRKTEEEDHEDIDSKRRSFTNFPSSSSLSLLQQVQGLHRKKKLWRASQQVLSVYEQQRMLLGNVSFLDSIAQKKREHFYRKRTSREEAEEERQMNLLRIAAARTRTAYIQFVADLHFVFTSFEELLTDGLEALLNFHPATDKEDREQQENSREDDETRSYLPSSPFCHPHMAAGEGRKEEKLSSSEGREEARRELEDNTAAEREGEKEDSSHDLGYQMEARGEEEDQEEVGEKREKEREKACVDDNKVKDEEKERKRGQEIWRSQQILEEFVSSLSFQKGSRSADDLFSVCYLLKRNPPSPSPEAQDFILRIADLFHRDFISESSHRHAPIDLCF
ncbi:hypothetical protein CSUI_000523, partial [Cystoisospora suis]